MPSKFLLLVVFAIGGTIAAEGTELVYATNPQYPPYDWADTPTTYSGACIELLPLVLPPGVTAKPSVLPWRRAQELAKTGAIDLLLCVRITPERSAYLKFTSHRAFSNPIVVFARRDAALTFRSWADLKGHPGGVSAGDSFGGGFDEYWRANLQVETAETMVENFHKLVVGRIEWFVTGKFPGQAFLAAHHLEAMIVPLDPPVSDDNIYFAFSARSPWVKLLPYVSDRLEALDKVGTSDGLLRKYLVLAGEPK